MLKKTSNILMLLLFFGFNLLAQDMDPDAAKAFNSGNVKMKAGDYQGAIAEYDVALAKSKDYRIYYQKGIALKKLNKLDESVATLKSCIEQNPKFDLAYNALGGSYFSLNQMELAIENFQKVLEFSTNNSVKAKVKEYISRSYAKLGQNALNDGNIEQALSHLLKSVENHNFDAAYLSLARAYSELAEWDKVISACENAIKYKSSISKGGPYYYMGMAYKNKSDVTKAKENFNLAKADPSYKKLAEYELDSLK